VNGTDVFKLLQEIGKTSSRSEKEAILARCKDDALLRRVLTYTCNPYITFGITPPKVETDGHDIITETSPVWSLLTALEQRRITGNDAKELVKEWLFKLNTENSELLWRILSKDLRAGFTANTVNKVIPGHIPEFDVMLAHKFEEKRIKSWPAIAEPKLDGVRVIALVEGNLAQFVSRNGREFPAMAHMSKPVVEVVKAAIERAKADPSREAMVRYLTCGTSAPAVMIDGEMVSGNFNKSVGDIRRKDEAATDAIYHIFDILPLKTFREKDEIALSYTGRRHIVEWVSESARGAPVKAVPRYLVNSVEEIHALYQAVRESGLEGLIIKPKEGTYQKKRSHFWLKIKAEETIEVRVTGAFEGTGKYEGMLGGLLGDVDGVEVSVGGGFSDQQRREFWAAWQRDKQRMDNPPVMPGDLEIVERLMEVEFHEITPDGSLRHPRFKRFRDDKAGEKEAAE
jgi:DNA ligase 1